MKEIPNEHIGEDVQVAIDEQSWAIGKIRFGDGQVVKVEFGDDLSHLNGYYPTSQVELLNSPSS